GLLATSTVSSQVPSLVNQQGRLLEPDGTPVVGAVDFAFAIYDGPDSGATELWSETQSVTLDEGYFSVRLGDETAIDPAIFDGSQLFLGVTVGSDDEMTPRQPLVSVPYAFMANRALNV